MARGLFLGLTLAQVTAIQTQAVSMLTSGKTTMNYSVDGVNIGKAFPMPVETVMEECRYALLFLSGTTRPIRRVKTSFRCA